MTADGLSTGLFVLGEDKALEVAEKENIPVYLIMKRNKALKRKCPQPSKVTRKIRNNHANFIFTLIAFVAIIVLMSVGFIFKSKA